MSWCLLASNSHFASDIYQDEFRKDVMQFLISRGHGRLVPSTDVESFPDAVLNGKRLDLYNLYREVRVCFANTND